ncbi:MAG: hypothetical protein WKF91_06765 [Segetibacter sp.]
MKKYILLSVIAFIFFGSSGVAQSEGAPITVQAIPSVSISGKPIEFSGNTIIAKEVLAVSLSLTSPDGKVTDLNTTTDKKGDYKLIYTKAFATGQYTITAKSADEKGEASAIFIVTTVTGATNTIQKDFFKSTQTIQKSLDAVLQSMDKLPSRPDLDAQKAKLEAHKKKLSELKAAEEKLAQALKDLIKGTMDVPLPDNYLKDLAKANEEMVEKLPAIEAKAEEIKNKSNICEMINTMMEVCGFASLVFDFKTKALKTLATNLTSDKLIPGGLDRYVTKGTDQQKEETKFNINYAQKTAIAATGGAAGIAGYIGTGLSLDLCSYLGKIMYAGYCEDLKGNFVTTFKATFQADNGLAWWIYDLDLKGELKLRYRKNTDISKGAEITGEFTGYRVRYGIYEDFEQVEKVPYGMELFKKLKYSPKAVDLNYFNNDVGAIAMAMIPGSFRIQVKGIVNDKSELRLQVVESALDAETEEKNTLWIILLNALLPIPVIKKFEIPIAKNKIIFRAVLKDQVYRLVQEKDQVSVEVKNQKTKLPLGTGVLVETKLNMALSNK